MLTFCNSHRTRIWTAISFFNDEECGGEQGNFQNIGWYLVNPGTCVVVYGNDLADVNRFWYIFAEAEDGTVWRGDFPTQVKKPDAFNICDHPVSSAHEVVGFRQIDVGDHDDVTVTFRL